MLQGILSAALGCVWFDIAEEGSGGLPVPGLHCAAGAGQVPPGAGLLQDCGASIWRTGAELVSPALPAAAFLGGSCQLLRRGI